ncbi:MAG: SusC/RagA family TonB-linked outer membrane protein, partial [Bacteroidales bacterium]|nr:SusC/RagA family TonB-linked outer membrane protein [Bacteroidales bacterium]
KKPTLPNSSEYAALRNQAGVNDGLGAYSQFSRDEIEGFNTGDPLYYPDNDWYGMFVRDFTLRQRAGVNVAGGSEKMKYYSNISYLHQEAPFKIADEPDRKYDPTPATHGVNFRSNLDLKFNNYLSAYMRLTGNVKHEQLAGNTLNRSIYGQILHLPPTMYGPLTPIVEDSPEASNQVVTNDTESAPAYGVLNRSGYSRIVETNVIAQAGVNLDLSFLTRGLSLGGSMAYQTYARNTTATSQNFERWVRSSDYGKLEFTKKGSEENTPLSYSKGAVFFYHMNLYANMAYERRFGDHSVQALAYYFYQQQEKEYGSGSNVLPYKRLSLGASALYGYKDRYFLKGDVGYSGSEQFHRDHRYIATPAISAAWILSKEDFLSGIDFISLLKLRASYGITANDQLGDARFLYLDYIDSGGNEGLRGNPELSAEKVKKQNYGIDLGLFEQFTVGFDYYTHKVDNMLISSSGTTPIYQGIPLSNYPKLNNGRMENKGFELEAGYNKSFSPDLSVYASLAFSRSKNKVIAVNESPLAEDYAYRYRTEGYPIGQQWALLVDYANGNGMFNSQAELDNSNLTYTSGTPRVGDLIYQDLNGDGTIDERDMAPAGSPSIPERVYSFNGGFRYKNVELGFLFQGVGNTSFFYTGLGANESVYQGVFSDMHQNAWTPERYAAGEKITFPALSLSQSTNHTNNDFFLMDGSYVRLKNVELAYSLPVKISRKIAAERIRFSLNAQNLFTIDNVKSKYVDPEIRNMETFQPFRVYNIGVSLTF